MTYLPPAPAGGYDLDDLPDDPHPRPARPGARRLAVGRRRRVGAVLVAVVRAVRRRPRARRRLLRGLRRLRRRGHRLRPARPRGRAGARLARLGARPPPAPPGSRPPVEHADDIVRNASLFHRRWGWWPMGGLARRARRASASYAADDRRPCGGSRAVTHRSALTGARRRRPPAAAGAGATARPSRCACCSTPATCAACACPRCTSSSPQRRRPAPAGRGADLLVSQPVADDYHGLPIGTAQLVARLPAGARHVVVPIVRYAGLHPHHVVVHPPGCPTRCRRSWPTTTSSSRPGPRGGPRAAPRRPRRTPAHARGRGPASAAARSPS